MAVVVRYGKNKVEFGDWFEALNWVRSNAVSCKISRKSDGVTLQFFKSTAEMKDEASDAEFETECLLGNDPEE